MSNKKDYFAEFFPDFNNWFNGFSNNLHKNDKVITKEQLKEIINVWYFEDYGYANGYHNEDYWDCNYDTIRDEFLFENKLDIHKKDNDSYYVSIEFYNNWENLIKEFGGNDNE
jgi:hypothetical protein